MKRNCKYCGVDDTMTWHRDKWGRIGYYCHLCYNCISSKERRGIVNLGWGARRKGKFKAYVYL